MCLKLGHVPYTLIRGVARGVVQDLSDLEEHPCFWCLWHDEIEWSFSHKVSLGGKIPPGAGGDLTCPSSLANLMLRPYTLIRRQIEEALESLIPQGDFKLKQACKGGNRGGSCVFMPPFTSPPPPFEICFQTDNHIKILCNMLLYV